MSSTIRPGTKLERSYALDRAKVNKEARTAEIAFASEEPYDRSWGREVLELSTKAVRMGRLQRGGPLLLEHDSREQIGVIESVRIDPDRVGRAVVRFGKSARAEEVFVDVIDGIRRNASVGYQIHKAVLAEKGDELDTYRVSDWEPFEVSIVSVPADASVGVGRSAAPAEPEANPIVSIPAPEIRTMSDQEVKPPVLDEQAIRSAAESGARKTIGEIIAIGEQFKGRGGDKVAADAIRAGLTVDAFRAKLMDHLSTQPLPAPASEVGMSGKEAKRYSVMRAIRALSDRDWSGAGLEQEVHKSILKRSGMAEAPNNGFFLPYEVQKRDLTAGTPSAGGFVVATDNLAGSFIDMLRNRSVVAQAGATMLTGLTGNVTIPKQTGANTAYWLANEATAITEGNLTLGQLALAPKNVGAYQEVSRQLMLQSDPSVDNLVMSDLAKVLGLAIDLAALEGSGASGQPTGISATGGIGSVTGTSLAYAGVIEFQTDVAAGNALAANCAYVTTPAVAGLLAGRARFSNTDTPLWDGTVLDGRIGGYRGLATNQVTAASMIFGDFSQVVIAEWGMLEIALNPYANFTAAITGIRAIQTVDVGIRYAAAFSRATSIT